MEEQKFYKYYISAYSEEHLLSATEIAQIYGVATENNEPHSKLISAYLDDDRENKIFYRTAKGYMMRVYGENEYAPLMFNFINNSRIIESDIKSITLENGNKSTTYKYKLTNTFI